MRAETMGDTGGSIVNTTLEASDDEIREIMNLVRSTGFTLVRGLPPEPKAFESFSDRFGVKFVAFQGRAAGRAQRVTLDGFSPTLATANVGCQALGWHAESSYKPVPPDFLFFFCQRSPRVSGETMLTDGARVYQALPEPIRAAARNTRVLYTMTINRHTQPVELAELLNAFKVGSVEELREAWSTLRLGDGEEWDATIGDDEIKSRFTYPLARKGHISGEVSIRTELQMKPPPQSAQGGPIPRDLLGPVVQAAHEQAYFHKWVDGDMIIIDNTRVMHARNATNDKNRSVLVRYGW